MRSAVPVAGALARDHETVRSRAVVATCVVVGIGFTLIVTLVPVIRLAYANVRLHVAMNTTEALIAALLAYLAIGRFGQSRRLRDLLLAAAFLTFAVVNTALSVTGTAAADHVAVGFVVWVSIFGRALGALSQCAAAFVPVERLVRDGGIMRQWVVGSSVMVAVVVALAIGAEASLSEVLSPELSPEAAGRPRIVGHPLALSMQVALLALFAASAVGFLHRSRAEGDELLFWLGAGLILRAFAHLNYFLFPSLYSEWVYTGDILRLASYGLFLVGATRELRSYWRAQTQLAVVAERRRMARELHDGLSQELAFIRSQLTGTDELPPGMVPHLAAAAERAVVESRRAFTALADVTAVGPRRLLQEAAENVAERAGARVDVVVDDVDLPAEVWEEFAWIVREAVSNAARHANAASIDVAVLAQPHGAALTVRDRGRGFDPSVAAAGYGLQSMRERAERIGAQFTVDARPGVGTTVEVVVQR
jgi:signal transduction histidine kinase